MHHALARGLEAVVRGAAWTRLTSGSTPLRPATTGGTMPASGTTDLTSQMKAQEHRSARSLRWSPRYPRNAGKRERVPPRTRKTASMVIVGARPGAKTSWRQARWGACRRRRSDLPPGPLASFSYNGHPRPNGSTSGVSSLDVPRVLIRPPPPVRAAVVARLCGLVDIPTAQAPFASKVPSRRVA